MAGSAAKSNGHTLTLAALAKTKRLPLDFLRMLGLHDLLEGGVGIPYYGLTGEELFVRERGSPRAGSKRFHQPEGVPLAAYGQWRLHEAEKAGFAVIPEGESDCWTLWHHGFPALGIPGASAFNKLEKQQVEAIQRIYVVREPGQGGDTFVVGVAKRLASLGWQGKLFELRMPDGVKDPADLHFADPERFKARLEQAIRDATPLELPCIATPKRHAAEPDQWPDPVPLGEVLEVPPFPLDALPGPMRTLTEELAWAINCPSDFVGVPMLALIGGALANSRHLRITRTHMQPPLLFAACVGRPGTAKSAPLKWLRSPFDTIQGRWLDDHRRHILAWEEANEETRGAKPVPRRCSVEDVTTESFGLLLQENQRGVVMIRNELSALIAGLNQYKKGGKGNDRQFYLNLWDGTPLTIDRKSDKSRDGAPLHVHYPFAAIIGTIQPDTLGLLRGEATRGALPVNDGLLDRFLFCYPAELPAIGEQWREVSQDTLDAWRDAIERLLGLNMVEEENRHRPFAVHLTSDGRQEWERFTQANAEEMNAEDFPPHLFGPWSKLKGYAARLALIIHYGRWAASEVHDEAVDGASVEAAARLVSYFKGHIRKVYSAIDADKNLAEARRVVRWIAQHALTRFSKRDAYQGLKGSFETVDRLEAVLAVVEKHGIIRPEACADRPGPGRKPSPTFEVHPSLSRTYSQNPHNSHNWPAHANSGNCGNCGNHFLE